MRTLSLPSNIKLSGPKRGMDKDDGKCRQSFCEIYIEVSVHDDLI
jgi:hypothetical protein